MSPCDPTGLALAQVANACAIALLLAYVIWRQYNGDDDDPFSFA